jgi:hypothetical protein
MSRGHVLGTVHSPDADCGMTGKVLVGKQTPQQAEAWSFA